MASQTDRGLRRTPYSHAPSTRARKPINYCSCIVTSSTGTVISTFHSPVSDPESEMGVTVRVEVRRDVPRLRHVGPVTATGSAPVSW